MTNQDVKNELRLRVNQERRITLRVLFLINESEKRRIFSEDGYPSSFEWLTKEFGYSASAAQRRLNSARLLRAVPAVAGKIESGELNLTNVARVQTVIRQEEKRTGQMSPAAKEEVLSLVESKSSREAEAALASRFPEATKKPEFVRAINEDEVRVQVTLTKTQLAKLERVREVASRSHRGPLCQAHNQLMAAKILGEDVMNPFRVN